jgi:hypothetical protein
MGKNRSRRKREVTVESMMQNLGAGGMDPLDILIKLEELGYLKLKGEQK